ncbi:hypothetical protein SH601_02110 [Gracilibacillus sp. S3-1-1]|uniref:Uncharacterized protein n=1 Tax=Gracilibacillus pellucidus TaxID=3095368 RepID=A0ACC6M1D6_9BACI|nr:hypothetical protein [Gracilibacillus sp. S3-1-1]MDX8044767.1 hypothetical protein [Gracilibacillus sp. S3-1-1]
MVKTKKVLLLVEGEKVEKELFDHLYTLYGLKHIEIVSYKTNIYAFYNRLRKDFSDRQGNIDFDSIDLPLFLNDYLKINSDNPLSEVDFSDIILIFDFDPHDPQFHRDSLIELLENFDNSTDKGKLFLNYPMVESYKHVDNLNDDSFLKTTVTLENIKLRHGKTSAYKKMVDESSCVGEIKLLDKKTTNSLMELHRKKLNYLTQGLNFNDLNKYRLLCEKQCSKLSSEKLIWVINTSLLHMLDEYGYIN